MQLVAQEREQLQMSLEEAGQRCLQLEQRCAHHAAEAQRAIRELELQRRLCSTEHRSNHHSPGNNSANSSGVSSGQSANGSSCSSNGQPTSLFNELLSCDLDELPTSTLEKHSGQMMHMTEIGSDGQKPLFCLIKVFLF